MTLLEVLKLLNQNNIQIGLEGDQLKINAAKGAMTPELMAILKENKQALLAWAKEKQSKSDSRLPAIKPVDRDLPIPLSFNQQRLWFIHKLAPDTASYNMPMALRLKGKLDVTALEAAMNQLLQRHEIFRTVLIEEGEQCFQHIISTQTWSAKIEPLADNSELQPLIQQEALKVFPLTDTPLHRTRIWQLGENDHVFMVTLHHMIADAISIENLLNDLAALYHSANTQTQNPLSPLPIQYADFSYWQQHTLKEGGYLDQQLHYWQQQLSNAPALLQLPTDRPRPPVQTSHGAILTRTLDKALVKTVKTFAQENSYTPYMVFLAAQQLLLGRYANQQDVCIASPIAGRHHKGTEQLVGFFVNTLILRNRFDDNPTVANWFNRVKLNVLSAFDNQDAPFDLILEKLDIERSNAYSPIAQIGFNYVSQGVDTGDINKLSLGELDIEVLEQTAVEAKYDMIWGLQDASGFSDNTITLSIEYNTDLFDESTIAQYISHYQQLLGNMLADLSAPVQKISLIDEQHLLAEVTSNRNEFEHIYPLTPMQRDLYLDTMIEPDRRRNYFGSIHRCYQTLDPARCQQTIDILTSQYAALRMRLIGSDKSYLDLAYSAIIERNHPESRILLKQLDWTDKTLSEPEFDERSKLLCYQPFDLANQSLIRFYLVIDSENINSMVITAHHACIDAYSLQVLSNNFIQVYQSLSNNREFHLTDDNFADYQLKQYYNCDNADSFNFFTQQAQGVEALSSPLGTKRPRQESRFFHYNIKDNPQHLEQIKHYCERNNTSLPNYLRAVYALVLQSYCFAEKNFYISDILAARPRGHDQEIGCYFEQRPTVINIEDNNSFKALIEDLDQTRQALGNDKRVSNSLQTRLFPQANAQFLFNFYLTDRYLPFGDKQSNFRIIAPEMDDAVNFIVMQDGNSLRYSLGYTDNVFEDRRFIERFIHLSQQILDGIDALNKLNLQLPAEVTGITDAQAAHYSKTSVISMINSRCELTPNAVAVIDKSRSLTYAELDVQANQLANHLIIEHAVLPGDRIALCHSANSQFMVALLATLKAGACYIPVDPNYPIGRIEHILTDSDARCILSESCLSNTLDAIDADKIYLDTLQEILITESTDTPDINIQLDDPLYTIYTSGSTGLPKGASVKQRGEINLIHWYNKEYQICSHDNVLIISAIGFDLTQKNLLAPLCAGATVVFPEQQDYDPLELLGVIAQQHITLVNCAPSAFYPLAESPESYQQLASLRLVLFGGEPIRMPSLINWLEDSSCIAQLVNMYGPTECTDISCAYRITEPRLFIDQPMPIGTANDNVQLFVADSEQRLLPRGLVGELLVGGESVGLGYINQPELTGEKFINHPIAGKVYRTGDLVKQLDDGNYVFINRIDHQIKLRGLRIELGEIEYALRKLPGVIDSLVMVNDETLAGYILTDDGKTPEEWRNQLANDLPEHMLPQGLFALKEWPLTANGKIDRHALPDILHSRQREFTAPQTSTEIALAAIWQDILGIEKVSIHDTFFELGGHSLLAARAVARIRDHFHKELPLREVFQTPTIAAIAEILDGEKQQSQLPAIDLAARANYQARYPLSYAQQRLWFIDQLDPGSPLYNMPFALRISGNLNIEALRQAFHDLVTRHESLRTRIVSEKGEAYQLIDSADNWSINFYTVDDDEQEIINRATEFVLAPFDLAAGPLFRAELLQQVSTGDYALLFSMHHIISDGWSIDILVRDLLALYQTHAQQQSIPLPPLTAHYVDYAIWQRQWLTGEVLQTQIDYWKKQLQGAENLELPTDFSRPAKLDASGRQFAFEIPDTLSQAARQLAQENRATLFMTLLAAFQVLISKYSNQTDISIGTPIANRPISELENMIGLFINTLVMRTEIEGDINFNALLAQTRETALNAYQHQDIPFELLIDELNVPRELSQTPLFQVMFILQSSSQGTTFDTGALGSIGNLQIEALGGEAEHTTAKFDITLNIIDSDDRLHGAIEYRTSLFTEDTIARMSNHFIRLLQAICDSPDAAIDSLRFISDEEQLQQLDFTHGWNATRHHYPACDALHHLFEQQVTHQADAIAVKDNSKQLSYAQLNEQANQLANYLIEQGVRSNRAVGVCLYRSTDMSVALLAILKAGGAYVPFDPDFPIDRLNFMAEDTGIQHLITSVDNPTGKRIQVPNILCVDNNIDWCNHSTENPSPALSPDNIFNIIYTSGSTGKPKGVMVPHRGIINRLRWMQSEYAINRNDRVLQKTPYSFDVSVWELFWPLIQGSTLVYAKPDGHKDPAYLRDLIQQEQITTMHFVPSMLGIFLQTGGIDECNSLRQVFCSGEALQLEHTRQFYQQISHATLHNLYGPTEASIDVSYYPCVADEPHRSIPIGKPIHNTQLHILDRGLNIVPVGVAGELYIGGEGLALGYLNRDELTAATFIDNPFYEESNPISHPSRKLYKTGDVTRYLSDGNIEYLGRTDHQIKIRGLRIELGEIESRLQKLENIREAIVVAYRVDNNIENQQLVAYLLTHDNQLDTHGIKATLAQELPEYMIPVHYMVLESWPLSANGKIDRKALPAPDLSQRSTEYVAPETELEQQLCTIWQQLLPVDQIGIHDNFFELGGHSLLATRLIAEIAQQFDIEITVRSIFEAPTIASLADVIDNTNLHQQALPAIVAVDRDQPLPLSFNQQRLWFVYKMAPEAASYNMPMAMRLKGNLNIPALESAVQQIIERHEIFRTALYEEQNEVFQRIVDIPVWQAEINEIANDASIEQLVSDEALKPFDLTTAPLLRIKLWQKDNETILVITLHHIISDAVSLEILTRELATFYIAASNNMPATLPPLPIQYADFAFWQQHTLKGEYLDKQLSYWQQQLQDAPALLKLPTDYPRPAIQTHHGAIYTASLEHNSVERVKAFALQHRLTPFMVLLAAQQLLLGRYAKQHDVCIGVPIAGRHQKGTEGLAGFFVNALIIRNRFEDNPSVENFFKRVKEQVLAGFAHQDAPFDRVIDQTTVERSNAYNPIVQVGFNYLTQDKDSSSFTFDDLTIEAIEQKHVDAKYDMIWAFNDSPAGIIANIEFNTDLFNESTIAQYFSHFEQLLNNMLDDLSAPVQKISIIDEKHLLQHIGKPEDDIERILPLTPMQRDLYLDTLLDPDNRRNYFGWIQRTGQMVDVEKFQQAIDLITAHFTTLRMRIVNSDRDYLDIAYAAIIKPDSPKSKITVQYLDWSEDKLDEASFNKRCNEIGFTPYNLSNEPIIRFLVIKDSPDSCAIVLTAHHACIDGISLQTVTDNYTLAYEGLMNNLPIEKIQQSLIEDNYASYLYEQYYRCDNENSYNFWQQQAQDVEALSSSLGDNSKQHGHYTLQEVKDSKQHFAAIQQYCEQNNTTPTLYIKALYTLMLQSYCYADNSFYFDDIIAARPKGHLQEVGCYFEQKPTIIRQEAFSRDNTFTGLLDYLNAYRKSIRGDTHISNSLRRRLFSNANVQFLFNYYLTDRYLPFMGQQSSLTFIVPEMDNAVTFTAIVDDNCYVFNFSYTDNCFEDKQFVERLLNLSHQVLAGTNDLSALSLQLPGEIEVTPLNEVSYETCSVISLIEAQAEKTPDAIAITDRKGSLTYAELNQKANQLAHYLKNSLKITPGDAIALYLSGNNRFMTALMATLKTGACYIPVDPNYPVGRIQHMLNDSGAKCIITETCLLNHIETVEAEKLAIDDMQAQLATELDSNLRITIALDDPLYIIYTSGSTGLPKGATVSQRGEINLLDWYQREFELSANDSVLIISATGFDLTQKNLLGPLCAGSHIIFPDQDDYDPQELIEAIAACKITLINCAPSAFYPLVESADTFTKLASLRLVLFGGEPIRMASLMPWLENDHCSAQLVNMYGPTECTDIASYYRITEPQTFLHQSVPIGKANDNVQLFVTDSSLRLLPRGLVGELLIAGESLGLGYINQPELTEKAFVDHPIIGRAYRTGDLVKQHEDGNLVFVNRIDHQVKLRGLRIELGEIETALKQLPPVIDSLVMVSDDTLAGYVLTDDGNTPDNWRSQLANQLPDYMIPQGLVALGQWPLTANGKIDRKALPALSESRTSDIVLPRNTTEETLAAIWRDVLGLENISVYDNFFELGGHSLIAARTVSRIREQFNQDLPLREVFFSPTIAAIAELLDQGDAGYSTLPAIEPAERDAFNGQYPLSFAQQRLWLIEQIQQAGTMYSIPMALSLQGDINRDGLATAIQQLVARHESLRTRLGDNSGTAYQYLAPVENYTLEFIEAESETDFHQQIFNNLQQAFTIIDSPLFRAALVSSHNQHCLLLNCHHIISDGLSSNIILQDLGALYQANCINTPAQLPPLRAQYIDYSLWQQKWLTEEVLNEQVSYWQQQLNNVPLLALPMDYPRSANNSTTGKVISFTIPTATASKLQALAQQQNATLFMVLLAAFKVLLYRYSGQQDISIGTPVANRPQAALENIVGFFVNTLVLRDELSGEQCFNELLQAVKETTGQAYSHQDLPFERLLDELDIPRDLSHTPLFQAFFSLQNASELSEQQSIQVAGTEISAYEPPESSITTEAKFELYLNMLEKAGELSGTIEYRTALFKEKTIQRLSEHFSLLLNSIADNADATISELQFITPEEQQLQLSNEDHAWNATATPIKSEENVQFLFEQQVTKTPDAIAVSDKYKSLSYLEFNQRVNQLANYLMKTLQIQPHSRVVICQPGGVDFLTSVYAAIKVGASYIPIDPTYPQDRIQHIIQDAQADLVLCDKALEAQLSELAENCLALTEDYSQKTLRRYSIDNPPNQITNDTPIYLIYTSGSTGLPKGVEVKHQGETNLVHWYNEEYGFNETDKFLVISAIGFDLTQKNFFAPLCCGGEIVFSSDGYDPDIIKQLISQKQITVMNCAPSALYPLIDSIESYPLTQSLRTILLGGEPIRLDIVKTWLTNTQHRCELVNMYGPTECTDITTTYRIRSAEDLDCAVIPIGKPIANTKCYILDNNLQLLPIGAVGELVIGGLGVSNGYVNNEELNQTSFIESAPGSQNKLYRTGDLVRYRDDGNIEYIGRLDHQVKIRGLRIELGEIETVLANLPEIREALVIATQKDHEDYLVAYLIAEQAEYKVDNNQLRSALARHLPDYMIPGFFVALDQWPLSPNGKINRKALPEPQWRTYKRTDLVAPRNPVEKEIIAIWQDVLKLEEISIEDNFFSIGGHSLKAAQVSSRLRSSFTIDIVLRDLFDAPTVVEQALMVEQKQQHPIQLPPITKLNRDETLPLSYAQQRLWFLAQMDANSPAYNMPASFMITGSLNIEALENAFSTLVERHETLRCNFVNTNGEPQLLIHSPQPFPLQQYSVTSEDEVQAIAQADTTKPFDLANDQLLRATLVSIAENRHALLLNMHHIISDGWSVQVLIKELGTLYLAYTHGSINPLPALDIQYPDFAAWQRHWLQGDLLEQELAYWRETLKDVPTLLQLPHDRPRPEIQSFNGALYKSEIPTELANKLREFSLAQGCTLFMSCLGAYQVLLSKYSHQEDICVGIPLAGRSIPGIENLIGFFINALIIRSDLSANLSIKELLANIKETTLSAFAHDQIPAEMMINELGIERSLAYTPVAQCAFNMISADENALPEGINDILGNIDISLIETDTVVSKFDMQFSLLDVEESLNLSVEYSTDLFDESTIARMVGHYIDILEAFADTVENEKTLHLYQIQLDEFELPEGYVKTLPLTTMQRDIYLATLANPDTLENSLGFSFQTPFAMNEDLWVGILKEVTSQYEILRADVIANNKPWQDLAYLAIKEETDIDYQLLDWSHEALTEEQIQERLDKLIVKPYDLQHSSRVSHRLIKLKNDHYWATMAAHHMILDGVAAVLIGTYQTMLYENRINGNHDAFIMEDHFADYIEENRLAFDSESTLDYWRHQLQDCAGLQATAGDGRETRLLSHPIPVEHYLDIKKYCKQFRITPPIYFKCLYALMIQQYTRADSNFVITEFNAGRNKTNMNDLGCFYHTHPTVIDINGVTGSMEELFNAAKAQQKSSRRHLQISHLKQVKLMPRSAVHFSYNYLMMPHESYMLGEKLTGTRYTPNAEGVVDMRVQAHGDELCFWLAYNTSIFDDKQFLQRMLHVSEQLVTGNIQHTHDIDLLLDNEAHVLSAPAQEDLKPLPMQISLQALATPLSLAVICGENSLSYKELDSQSNAIAHALMAQGVSTGDRVGICLGRRVELITTILGTVKAGACYIPMDPAYPEDRLAYMLEDSSAAVLITENCVLSKLPQETANRKLINIDSLDLANFDSGIPKVKIEMHDLIYMIYTSGSTGLPKGASVYHRSESNLLSWYIEEYGFTQQDRSLIISATGFDLTQKNFFALLTVGGTIVLPDTDHYDVKNTIYLIDKHAITHINCAPSAFYPLVELSDEAGIEKLNKLNTLCFGGEPIHISRLASWIESDNFDCRISNMYGPTECTDISTSLTLSAKNAKGLAAIAEQKNIEFPLGKPSAGVSLYILNERNQPVPEGLPGELCVAGISVGAGYWQKPELTADTFIPNPFSKNEHDRILYRTGDLVRLERDNSNNPQLYYIGRKDFQVKLRGLRIELGEIENALRAIDAISDVTVMVEDDQLLAFALTDIHHMRVGIDGWRESLMVKLPDYMVPKQLIAVTEWPLTPNGKIDRSALLALERPDQSVQFVAPRTEMERDIASLWQEVLGIGKAGVFDNFFESGGDSLAAVRLVARIELHYDIKIPVASLFGAQTIAQLAHVIDNRIHDWSPVVPIQPEGSKTPIFAVHALGALVLSYEPLARALGKDQPFYGIQAYGFEEGQTPFTDLDEMVNFYMDAITRQQPKGPYQLMGHSFGGLIAIEIARKLKEQGEEVNFVMLLDTYMPNKYASGAVDDALILKTFAEHNFGVVDIPLKTMRLMKPEAMIKTVADRFNGIVSEDFIRSAIEILRGFQRMMIGFKPQPLNVPIVLFRPEVSIPGFTGKAVKIVLRDKAKNLGWHKITNTLEVIDVDGDHHSMLKDDINKSLVNHIQFLLDQKRIG